MKKILSKQKLHKADIKKRCVHKITSTMIKKTAISLLTIVLIINVFVMFKCLLGKDYYLIIFPAIGISTITYSIKWIIKNIK